MVSDPKNFVNYCKSLGGTIKELKTKKVSRDFFGKKEEWEEIVVASCEFKGRELELFPTGYEHDEGAIKVDDKEVSMSYDGGKLAFELKNIKDVEEISFSANYGGKIKFSKPKKFILDQDAKITLVE
jgi:hypothetical protein